MKIGETATAEITYFMYQPIGGNRIVMDRNEMEFCTRDIPKHKFVQYEPKDLEWMIPLGMAPEIKFDVELMDRVQRAMYRRIESQLLFGFGVGSSPYPF